MVPLSSAMRRRSARSTVRRAASAVAQTSVPAISYDLPIIPLIDTAFSFQRRIVVPTHAFDHAAFASIIRRT